MKAWQNKSEKTVKKKKKKKNLDIALAHHTCREVRGFEVTDVAKIIGDSSLNCSATAISPGLLSLEFRALSR
jgi:quinolinate synthase